MHAACYSRVNRAANIRKVSLKQACNKEMQLISKHCVLNHFFSVSVCWNHWIPTKWIPIDYLLNPFPE